MSFGDKDMVVLIPSNKDVSELSKNASMSFVDKDVFEGLVLYHVE